MDELITWLRAQLDEDEFRADEFHYSDCRLISWGTNEGWCDCNAKARVLAEVEAKRRILDQLWDSEWGLAACNAAPETATVLIKLLAQPYAEQPGWRDEWAVTQSDRVDGS